jgi:hypothetical protein
MRRGAHAGPKAGSRVHALLHAQLGVRPPLQPTVTPPLPPAYPPHHTLPPRPVPTCQLRTCHQMVLLRPLRTLLRRNCRGEGGTVCERRWVMRVRCLEAGLRGRWVHRRKPRHPQRERLVEVEEEVEEVVVEEEEEEVEVEVEVEAVEAVHRRLWTRMCSSLRALTTWPSTCPRALQTSTSSVAVTRPTVC